MRICVFMTSSRNVMLVSSSDETFERKMDHSEEHLKVSVRQLIGSVLA